MSMSVQPIYNNNVNPLMYSQQQQSLYNPNPNSFANSGNGGFPLNNNLGGGGYPNNNIAQSGYQNNNASKAKTSAPPQQQSQNQTKQTTESNILSMSRARNNKKRSPENSLR